MGDSDSVETVDAAASVDELLLLYDTHATDVYGFVLRRCGDVGLAEDLAQDVFVAAARRVRDTSEVPSPAWLYQVARSRLIDHWRREGRRVKKLRLLSGGRVARSTDPADEGELASQVMAVLDELPTSQRSVLVLRYLDGYSVGQVAEMLGRTTKAAESLLVRARRNFELAFERRDHE